jgi:hypothetical protein
MLISEQISKFPNKFLVYARDCFRQTISDNPQIAEWGLAVSEECEHRKL